MNDEEKTGELEEPSVLDYVKSLLRFGNGERIQIPEDEECAHQASEGKACVRHGNSRPEANRGSPAGIVICGGARYGS